MTAKKCWFNIRNMIKRAGLMSNSWTMVKQFWQASTGNLLKNSKQKVKSKNLKILQHVICLRGNSRNPAGVRELWFGIFWVVTRFWCVSKWGTFENQTNCNVYKKNMMIHTLKLCGSYVSYLLYPHYIPIFRHTWLVNCQFVIAGR